jgi:hypothetical protein
VKLRHALDQRRDLKHAFKSCILPTDITPTEIQEKGPSRLRAPTVRNAQYTAEMSRPNISYPTPVAQPGPSNYQSANASSGSISSQGQAQVDTTHLPRRSSLQIRNGPVPRAGVGLLLLEDIIRIERREMARARADVVAYCARLVHHTASGCDETAATGIGAMGAGIPHRGECELNPPILRLGRVKLMSR